MFRLLALLLIAFSCKADDNIIQHSGTWFTYSGDHAWSEHWGLHAEGQFRRVDGFSKGQQLVVRPGVNYEVNSHLKFMVAYTNTQYYSFDRFSFRARINEHRIHEEASVSHPLLNLKIQHRLRLEQRFGDYAGDWQYRNRLRYRFQAVLPVTKRTYLVTSNEVYVSFGSHSSRSFDQNRTYGAVGRDFGKPGKLEFGYLYQYQQVTGVRFRQNHLIQVAFFSRIPLRKQR